MRLLPILLFTSLAVHAATLPGFRLEPVAQLDGFVSSVVTASDGTIYVTTTDGWIHRVTNGQASRVASLPTHAGSNSGLLGMALADDQTAIVHYTVWGSETIVLDDVISRVDLTTGAETVLHAFACDVEVRAHGASPEHHGGNPTIAPDGSIFVGIGEYGSFVPAQTPGWNGGRVWRLSPAGDATQWANGLRNPYDLAWDPELARVVVTDNGPKAGDEVNVINVGSNCGWPETYGSAPSPNGMTGPDDVFPKTVAPTGITRLAGTNPILQRGYLLGAFVTRALYYFPSITAAPIPDPIAIVDGFDQAVIDVTEAWTGEIFVATAGFPASTTIWRLVGPARGECDGNGLLDWRDMLALYREVDDGDGAVVFDAQLGSHAGSWGCDANADGLIDARDSEALRALLGGRRRAAGGH
jgi:glucose/arabinose dehydrogenase